MSFLRDNHIGPANGNELQRVLVPPAGAARQIVPFGAHRGEGWGVGLTIFTALGNLLPVLSDEGFYLALFHGARQMAADCEDNRRAVGNVI
jgi:hypothetical protein